MVDINGWIEQPHGRPLLSLICAKSGNACTVVEITMAANTVVDEDGQEVVLYVSERVRECDVMRREATTR
jgi:hypothetical protein